MPLAQPPGFAGSGATVVGAILDRAAENPQALALADAARSMTFGELARRMTSVAADFVAMGVAAGDRVLLEAASTCDYVTCYFALHLIRGICLPTDPSAPRSRRELIVERVGARFEIDRNQQAELSRGAAKADRMGSMPDEPARSRTDVSDVADLMFTSGTTGEPKGVMLTHGNLAVAARHINAFVGARSGDIEVVPLPLAHAFGLGCIRSALGAGATVVLVDGFAFPGQVFAALDEYRATALRSVPAGFAIISRFAPNRLADYAGRIRYIEIGSAPMPLPEKRALMESLPRTRICMHYGLTEAARTAFIEFHQDAAHLESVGRPSAGVEVRIADEDGRPLPARSVGELQIRGGHVMRGYWDDPVRTRAAFCDGWLRSGDTGFEDGAGRLHLLGRSVEVINVGGRKVFPVEVEDALRGHASVMECGCVAVDDPAGLTGDAVAAVVVLHDGQPRNERALRDFLRSRLESYKIPAKWVFADSLPKTSNGKLKRTLLREQLSE